MARRSDHTRDELRKMIIAAGQEIISEEGFGKFSARKIAKRIGYTVGTVYNIFHSHNDLILNINAVTLEDMKEFILSQKKQDKIEVSVNIKYLANSYLEFAKQNYARWSALFEHSLPLDYEVPDWYDAKIKSLFLLIEEPLQLLGNENIDIKKSAQTIWASIHGICLLGLTGKLDIDDTKSISKLIDDLIDNYIKGIKA